MSLSPEFKQNVLRALLAHFEGELKALLQSAKAAHEAATHEESRAEDRHDTFAIELSYLAQGQAVRVQDIRKSITELSQFLENPVSNYETKGIGPGDLVLHESTGKKTYSFIANFGGGTQVTVDQKTVSLLSPKSPLGDNLVGLKTGDSFTTETPAGEREHEVLLVV